MRLALAPSISCQSIHEAAGKPASLLKFVGRLLKEITKSAEMIRAGHRVEPRRIAHERARRDIERGGHLAQFGLDVHRRHAALHPPNSPPPPRAISMMTSLMVRSYFA